MQKTVMAVAVAGALGALAAPPVLAQTSTVQIGGSIHLIYVQSRGKNSGPNGAGNNDNVNHDNLHTSEPEMFVRGEENIGGGNAVWFQCTSTIDVLGAATNASAGDGLCGRNSAIGMKGSWGNVFFGNWDNPHKLMVTPIRGWFGLNNAFAGAGRMLWNTPGSDVFNTGSSFSRRAARSVNYHSPTWGGFAFRAMYSAQNEATNLSASTLQSKPRMWSADVTYRSGPLYLGAGYERHKDFNPSSGVYPIAAATAGLASSYSGGTDDSWVFGASYTFGGFLRLAGLYTRNELEVHNTGQLKHHGWWVLADWTIAGPHSLKANYARRGDVKGNVTATIGNLTSNDVGAQAGKGTGGKVYGIQYAYEFSKRSTGYLGYNRAKGDAGAKDGLGISAVSLGTAQTVWGAGFRHRF